MAGQVRVTFNGQQITDEARSAAADGLRLAAEHVLGVSRQQVPHETGALEASGVASVDEDDLQAAVSYDTPYAVAQHEDMTYRHDDGRKAKYLEDPVNDETDTLQDIIATQIRRALS